MIRLPKKLSDYKKLRIESPKEIKFFQRTNPNPRIVDVFKHMDLHNVNFVWMGNVDVVGVLSINPEKGDGHIWLSTLFVNPKYENRGFGSEILEFAIDRYHIDALIVKKTDKKAIHLYEKHGFVIVAEGTDLYHNGVYEMYRKCGCDVDKREYDSGGRLTAVV